MTIAYNFSNALIKDWLYAVSPMKRYNQKTIAALPRASFSQKVILKHFINLALATLMLGLVVKDKGSLEVQPALYNNTSQLSFPSQFIGHLVTLVSHGSFQGRDHSIIRNWALHLAPVQIFRRSSNASTNWPHVLSGCRESSLAFHQSYLIRSIIVCFPCSAILLRGLDNLAIVIC